MKNSIDLTRANMIQNFTTTEESVSVNVYLNESEGKGSSSYSKDDVIVKIIVLTAFPLILVIGTIGNSLTLIVMQRGMLKHSSTCLYMVMLAVADTCKYSIIIQRGPLKHSSTCF